MGKEDEEDRESIVEKDQIEEMETSPINHHEKDFVKVGDDDEDAELQRIKDEEEEEDNQERVPDIGPSEEKKEADDSPPRELNLEKAAPKVAYSHVRLLMRWTTFQSTRWSIQMKVCWRRSRVKCPMIWRKR